MSTKRIILVALVTAFGLCTGFVMLLGGSFEGASAQTNNFCSTNFGRVVAPAQLTADGSAWRVGDSQFEMNATKMGYAAVAYSRGRANPQIGDDQIIMAFMTAFTESRWVNYSHRGEANDHESWGLLQAQSSPEFELPDGSQYWGFPAELMNPVFMFDRFYRETIDRADEIQGMTRGDAIQQLWNSDFPDRYAGWEDEAIALFELFESYESGEVSGDVAVIGDSLTVGANKYLYADLAEVGYETVRVDAQGGRNIDVDTVDYLVPTTSRQGPTLEPYDRVLVSGLTAIRTLRESGYDPQSWIVLLGTNDLGYLSNDPGAAYEQSLSRIGLVMDEINSVKADSDYHVMWLSVVSTRFPERAAIWNQALAAKSSEHENMLVGDWASMVAENPQWLVDSVHYSDAAYQERSKFVAQVAGTLSNSENMASRVVVASNVNSRAPKGCNFGSGVVGPAPDAPIHKITNPDLARAAMLLEEEAGCNIVYGAPRQKWLDLGRRGNFGHGDQDQWKAQSRLGPQWCSLDCSGAMNRILYLARGIRYSGASYTYIELTLDGQVVTAPVMRGGVDPSLLRPGDFIIKSDRADGGGEINHIQMVITIQSSNILIVESTPSGDGYRQVWNTPADYEQEGWENVVVSRWIGPGASVIGNPATTSTTAPQLVTAGVAEHRPEYNLGSETSASLVAISNSFTLAAVRADVGVTSANRTWFQPLPGNNGTGTVSDLS